MMWIAKILYSCMFFDTSRFQIVRIIFPIMLPHPVPTYVSYSDKMCKMLLLNTIREIVTQWPAIVGSQHFIYSCSMPEVVKMSHSKFVFDYLHDFVLCAGFQGIGIPTRLLKTSKTRSAYFPSEQMWWGSPEFCLVTSWGKVRIREMSNEVYNVYKAIH